MGLLDRFLGRADDSQGRGMRLMQVFEGTPGRMVCRLFIASPTPDTGKHLSFRTLEGKPLEVEPIALDAFYDGRGLRSFGYAVVSASLPKMQPFIVLNRGREALRVTQDSLDEMVHQRERMMVDPGADPGYASWMEEVEEMPGHSREWVADLPSSPLFSIIVVLSNTPDAHLRDMLDSVLAQTYGSWELVLVNASPENARMRAILAGYDDQRIRIIEPPASKGAAADANEGIRAARGGFVCFLDQGDVLSPDILAEYARVASGDQQVDLLYCDEDSLSAGGTERFDPRFKPELNEMLLHAIDYVGRFACVSRRVVDAVEPTPDALGAAQGYDLVLKAVEVARSTRRIPVVGYHRRCPEGLANGGRANHGEPCVVEAGIGVLSDHFRRIGADASIAASRILGARIIEPRPRDDAETAIVAIPGRAATLASLVESLQECDLREEMTIYYADARMQPLSAIDADVRSVAVDKGASLAARANAGIAAANGEIVILASTDIRFLGKDDLRLLVGGALMPGVGIVAPKALFADGLVQHAGLCIHDDGSIGYLNQNLTAEAAGYLGTAGLVCCFSALDPQCLAFRKEAFDEVGGFDERFASPVIAGVDFCFKLREAGYEVMGLPHVLITSFAPFFDNWKRKGLVKGSDIELLWSKWPDGYRSDVLAHPNVDLNESYFHLDVRGIS